MAQSPPEAVEEADVVARALSAQGLVKPVASVEEALERAAGVSGANPSGPLSLAVRVESFEPEVLDRAMEGRRSVVRVPAMRGAVYLLPTRLAAAGLALSRPGQFRPPLRRAGLEGESFDALAHSVESVLSGKRLTGREIRQALRLDRVAKTLSGEVFTFFLRGLSHEGRLLRVGVRGGPRSQLFEYVLSEEWFDLPLRIPAETGALARLLPFYLEAHGPASVKDVAWWAGVTRKVAAKALQAVDTRSVRLGEGEESLFTTSSSLNHLDRSPEDALLTLLPHWDPYLMAHADRSRYIPAAWRENVVDRGGNTTNVVLRDGRVAGVWDYSGGSFAYASLGPRLRPALLRRASRPLRSLLGDLAVVQRARAPSLYTGKGSSFRAPLRKGPAGRSRG